MQKKKMRNYLLLAVWVAARYRAAREYGSQLLAYLERKLQTHFGPLDRDESCHALQSDASSTLALKPMERRFNELSHQR